MNIIDWLTAISNPNGVSRMAEEYLGDGLYVSFDGWHFVLRSPKEGGENVIYLEPIALQGFEKFIRETKLKESQRQK